MYEYLKTPTHSQKKIPIYQQLNESGQTSTSVRDNNLENLIRFILEVAALEVADD